MVTDLELSFLQGLSTSGPRGCRCPPVIFIRTETRHCRDPDTVTGGQIIRRASPFFALWINRYVLGFGSCMYMVQKDGNN